MNEAFEIPVLYKGEEMSLPAEFIVLQNVYKIQIEVNGQEITFEPDEEKKFKATMDPKKLETGRKIDAGLLKAVADKLENFCNIRSY